MPQTAEERKVARREAKRLSRLKMTPEQKEAELQKYREYNETKRRAVDTPEQKEAVMQKNKAYREKNYVSVMEKQRQKRQEIKMAYLCECIKKHEDELLLESMREDEKRQEEEEAAFEAGMEPEDEDEENGMYSSDEEDEDGNPILRVPVKRVVHVHFEITAKEKTKPSSIANMDKILDSIWDETNKEEYDMVKDLARRVNAVKVEAAKWRRYKTLAETEIAGSKDKTKLEMEVKKTISNEKPMVEFLINEIWQYLATHTSYNEKIPVMMKPIFSTLYDIEQAILSFF